jgi:hypothetical protein
MNDDAVAGIDFAPGHSQSAPSNASRNWKAEIQVSYTSIKSLISAIGWRVCWSAHHCFAVLLIIKRILCYLQRSVGHSCHSSSRGRCICPMERFRARYNYGPVPSVKHAKLRISPTSGAMLSKVLSQNPLVKPTPFTLLSGLHRQCLFGGLRIGLYEPVSCASFGPPVVWPAQLDCPDPTTFMPPSMLVWNGSICEGTALKALWHAVIKHALSKEWRKEAMQPRAS